MPSASSPPIRTASSSATGAVSRRAAISVVAYDDPLRLPRLLHRHRGAARRGYGWQLWTEGLRRLGDRCIGLDGVLAQEANYRRSGFALAHRQIRAGQITLEPPGDGRDPAGGRPFRAAH
ncbi:MAG: hypothetical protein U1E38_09765 [Rhodospirillales bacterium]